MGNKLQEGQVVTDSAQSAEEAPRRSAISAAVERLKSASFKAAAERERVPQPMFWSLFTSELEAIKAKKREARLLSSIFGGSGE